MATIMRKYYSESETNTEAILYVDSVEESAYIKAIKSEIAKELKNRAGTIDKYGQVNLTGEIILKNINQLNSVMDEYIIVETCDPLCYKLTLYKRVEVKGWIWNSHEYKKVCDIYYAECGRVVPLRKPYVDPQKTFEKELSSAVAKYKRRAEKGDIFISNSG